MRRFIKTVFIVGLCGAGTIALAHAILGKERTHDAAHALQNMAQGSVDELIANQRDIKGELEKLRREYPKQIAFLRHQLAEIDREIDATVTQDTRSSDIVRMCEEDISYLQNQQSILVDARSADRLIKHRGALYTPSEADTLIARIEETRSIYSTRASDNSDQRTILQTEREAIVIELEAIRSEQAEFEVEYQSLLREIERLKRNEEMLKLAEKRRGMGESRHGQSMETLVGVKSAIEKARMEQEERLKSVNLAPRNLSYESRAKLLELQRRREAKRKTEPASESEEKLDSDSFAADSDEEELLDSTAN